MAHSSQSKVTTTMPSIIQMLMHWMRLRWRRMMVMIWYFDNKSPLSINIFCPVFQMGDCWAWVMFAFIFLRLDVFELLCNLLQNQIWLWSFPPIFLSFGTFGCQCIAFLFCIIISVSKQLLSSIKFCWRRWF